MKVTADMVGHGYVLFSEREDPRSEGRRDEKVIWILRQI